ncbi:folliculin isoform X1 [Hydra vulgaris]|nr:folliculin [Hydra vulgaris]
MNAVIALCHFCELHGPSILFCTKPFHCINHTESEIESGTVEASPLSCGVLTTRLQSYVYVENKEDEIKQIKRPMQEQSSGSQSTCEGCRSLEPGELGFISFNKESHISYVSTQHPEEQELYSVLRHACVRSLSCEICPGREGPIMFGDDASGYVFSYTFFLKDSLSRGFQRWYSIICVMMDRNYLVTSWPFLISNFRTVIGELQSKADIYYKNEQSEKPQLDSHFLPRKTVLTPDAFRRSRGGQIYRSLRQIINEKNVFEKLHKAFSWIIQASCERYTEKLFEGTSMSGYMDDEEMTSSLLEDFILKGCQDYNHPIFTSILHAYQVIGKDNFHLLAFHVVRGDQVVVQSDFKRTAVSLIKVLKDLIPAGCFRCQVYEEEYQDSWRCNFLGLKECCEIPQHLLSSNQIVVVAITREKKDETASASHFRLCENSFDGFQIHVTGAPVEKEPSYLTSIMESLSNEHINDELFMVMLVALKERWMGRVKILFKFSKDSKKLIEEKDRLLAILQSKSDDEILLKYWMTSLSKSYRLQLLNKSFSSVA